MEQTWTVCDAVKSVKTVPTGPDSQPESSNFLVQRLDHRDQVQAT